MAYKASPSFPSLATVLVVVVVAAAFRPSAGVTYKLVNKAAGTLGGRRFELDIGEEFILKSLSRASDFIRGTFEMPDGGARDDVDTITFYIDANMTGLATSSGTEIHMNAKTIADLPFLITSELRRHIYHLVTHIWQWKAKGEPLALVEGMADYMALSGGYPSPNWVSPGAGSKWDEKSDVTMRFLEFCSINDPKFVAKLNAAMRNEFDVRVFEWLTGKTVEELFKDYKAYVPEV